MAKATTIYEATVGSGDARRIENIDIMDLSNVEMGPDARVVINDDVTMGKGKKRPLPDFRYVDILGELDCADFVIGAETVLPLGIKGLKCGFAIGDLSVLIGKLPKTCKTVYVRHALLNNVKNNKDGALDAARKFAQKYPRVNVVDGKGANLHDIFVALDELEKLSSKKADAVAVAAPVNVPDVKTAEWLSDEELVNFCRASSSQVAGLSDKDLKRLIKMARSPKANLGLRIAEKMRADDKAIIKCIHRDDVSRVADYVAKFATTVKQTVQAQPQPKQKKDASVAQPVVTAKKKKSYDIGSRSGIRRVKIDKYFIKSAWKKVMQLCGTDKLAMLRVLNTINSINIMPTKTEGNAVFYIGADGKVQKEPSVEFKSQDCLAQSLGSLSNDARIVWAVSATERRFVAEEVFATHSRGKHQHEYKGCIRATKFNPAGYNYAELLSVSDLIEKLSNPHGRPGDDGNDDGDDMANGAGVGASSVSKADNGDSQVSGVVTNSASVDRGDADILGDMLEASLAVPAPVAEQVSAADTKPVINSLFIARTAPRMRVTRQVVDRIAPNAEVKRQYVAIKSRTESDLANNGAGIAVLGAVARPAKAQKWGAVYSLLDRYEQMRQDCEVRRKALVKCIAVETNAEQLNDYMSALRIVVAKIRKCESAIEELQGVNTALHKLQCGIDGKQK